MTREATIAALRARLRATDLGRRPAGRAPLALGLPAVDALLLGGGLSCGVHEVRGEDGDPARLGFAAALLARLPVSLGRILWCRTCQAARAAGHPYGPGLAAFGLAPERLILAETPRGQETLWALEEGLRCRRLAAVLGEGVEADLTASRRLQLAAEAGDTLGLLLPAPGKPSPSVARTRWHVAAAPAGTAVGPRWSVSLLRCRSGDQGIWTVGFDDEALRLTLSAELADRPLAAAQ